jgi:hypothetical protein
MRVNATHPEQVQAAENRREAIRLRKAGRSYRSIAARLGVSVSTAYGYIVDALNDITDETRHEADLLRTLEHERLNHALSKLTASEAFMAGEPAAIGAAVRISESVRRLYGLDQATRREQADPGRVVFKVTVPDPAND